MFKRIDTVFLPVRNLDQAVKWYTEQLGLTVRWQMPGYACLDLGETPLTLAEAEGEFNPTTQPSFNLFASDIDAVYHQLMAAGIQVAAAINDEPGVRWFDFADLDGNQLQVCSWPET